jgi:hypothetical protein
MVSREVCHACRVSALRSASDIRKGEHMFARWCCPHTDDLVYTAMERPPKRCTRLLEHAIAESIRTDGPMGSSYA